VANFEPRFEARPSTSLDGGWCVHILWDSEKPDIITGFLTQYEALDWIKNKSANWVADYIIRNPRY
jgi:hypothetical protein